MQGLGLNKDCHGWLQEGFVAVHYVCKLWKSSGVSKNQTDTKITALINRRLLYRTVNIIETYFAPNYFSHMGQGDRIKIHWINGINHFAPCCCFFQDTSVNGASRDMNPSRWRSVMTLNAGFLMEGLVARPNTKGLKLIPRSQSSHTHFLSLLLSHRVNSPSLVFWS